MNQLLNDTPTQPRSTNPIALAQTFLSQGGTPQQLASRIKPNAIKQVQQQVAQSGLSPRDFAMRLAQQRGIDPAQVSQLAQMMGLK